MTAWRIVRTRDGVEDVSSVVLSALEAADDLQVEADLHRLAGWTVTQGIRVVVARMGSIERIIEAREYDPFAAFDGAENRKPPGGGSTPASTARS